MLTTCARDPLTWKNEYAEGADRVRGVLVRRFAVNQLHDRDAFQQLSRRLFAGGRDRAPTSSNGCAGSARRRRA